MVETMIMNKASKGRLYPDKEQLNKANQTLGHCRYVYNQMLKRQEKIYKRRGEHLTYNEMQNLLPDMKKYRPWLKEADSQALKYACRQLDNAFNRFFNGLGSCPVLKKKRGRQSYTTTAAKSIRVSADQKGIKLPVLGWVNVSGLNIPKDAVINKATVSRDPDGKYYVSVAYKVEIDDCYILPPREEIKAIGFDFREGDLYCDSDGLSAGKPNDIMRSMRKLKYAQEKLSRMIESHITGYKTIGNKRYPIYDRPLYQCKNIQKQRKRIARIHKHIANQRMDFLQKRSTAIVKQYDVICIEDFKVSDMIIQKDEDPSAVKRHNINRKVYDDGWYMFTKMLEYKASWNGKRVVRVDEDYPSTQICSCCNRQSPKTIELGVKRWTCPSCREELDRDHNAARNTLKEGLRLLYAA